MSRINLIRGTTKLVAIDIVDEFGSSFDLAKLQGASAEFNLRVQPTDMSNVLRYTTAANPNALAFAVDASTLNLTFQGPDTANLATMLYFYQVLVTLADGSLYDIVPWDVLDLNLGGAGSVAPPSFDNTIKVTADYPLAGDMQYMTPGGSPIVNAQVRVYKKSDYDAGNLTAPVGITATDANGKWVQPILVTTGYTYTARFEKPYEFGPDTKEFFA